MGLPVVCMSPRKPYRATCYIDGFNLYHAIDALGQPEQKRVNLCALTTSLLREHEVLSGVEYFSANATWRPPGYRRHQLYTTTLEGAGVTLNLAHFKERDMRCRNCGHTWVFRKEKETDVRLALCILKDAFADRFGRAIIMSADSDLVPVVETVKRIFPDKQLLIAAPPKRRRVARDLIRAAHNSALELSPA